MKNTTLEDVKKLYSQGWGIRTSSRTGARTGSHLLALVPELLLIPRIYFSSPWRVFKVLTSPRCSIQVGKYRGWSGQILCIHFLLQFFLLLLVLLRVNPILPTPPSQYKTMQLARISSSICINLVFPKRDGQGLMGLGVCLRSSTW